MDGTGSDGMRQVVEEMAPCGNEVAQNSELQRRTREDGTEVQVCRSGEGDDNMMASVSRCPRDVRNVVGEGDSMNAKSAAALNEEAIYYVHQRLDELKDELDELSVVKEEYEELRQFRDWAEPELRQLEKLRSDIRELFESIEEGDKEYSVLKEEVKTLTDFKESSETAMTEMDQFRRDVTEKLRRIGLYGEKGKRRKLCKGSSTSMKSQ